MSSSETERFVGEYNKHQKRNFITALLVFVVIFSIILIGLGFRYSTHPPLVQTGIVESTFYVQPTDNGRRASVRLSVKLNSGQFVSVGCSAIKQFKKGDVVKVSTTENYYGLQKHSLILSSNNDI